MIKQAGPISVCGKTPCHDPPVLLHHVFLLVVNVAIKLNHIEF